MKLSLKIVRKTVLSLAFLLLVGGSGFWLGRTVQLPSTSSVNWRVDRAQPAAKNHLDLSMFWDVWDRLEQSYFDRQAVDAQKMIWGAIQGMTAALDDPYTVFLPPKDNQRAQEDLNGFFEGVGIELGYRDEILAVIAPLEGMPAKAAGIRAGDLIVHVKDEAKNVDVDTLSMSLPQAVEIIRGPKGTPVTLSIIHSGEQEVVEIAIVRGTIIVSSVQLDWVEGDIAHLQLFRFGERTPEEWDQAVTEITDKCSGGQRFNCSGIILDLRNNPGGYLEAAVNLASEFIAQGVVVKQENAGGSVETYSVTRRGKLLEAPIVVLINKGSASSSEILAGALKVRRQIELIGETSFGKGTIQEAQELGGGAGLHVTTARWLLPDDTWVNEAGLEPDYQVEDDRETEADEQFLKAIEVLNENNN
ncbi:S41 family peptidase [Patescibacteria group bacterium]|nr:S41 family peptidase [Patescibacteria group bacterium]MBU1931676.1 S41 family peptidase [Patescibacteria group bacterium]